MKEHYKGIILVIASEDVENTRHVVKRIIPEWIPLYPTFKLIYEQYMNENPNIKIFFLYGADTKFEPKSHDLIYESVFENEYPGMITKTLLAMQHVTDTYSYDFIIRTNLSTFWDLNRLEKRLDKLPKTNCLTGHEIRATDLEGNNYHYIAGFDMVMSKDIIEKILPYKNEIIDLKLWQRLEDLSLCHAFKTYANTELSNYGLRNDASWMGMDPFNEEHYKKTYNLSIKFGQDHYRVKTRSNRNIDKEIHKLLLKDIYGKTLL